MARLGAVLRAASSATGQATLAATSSSGNGVHGVAVAEDAAGRLPANGVPASVFAGEAAGQAEQAEACYKAAGHAQTVLGKDDSAMAGIDGGCAAQQSRPPAEVMPGCRAKIALVNGSPGLSSDALAPLSAKTMAHVASGHLGT
jgi:hypothetical protein